MPRKAEGSVKRTATDLQVRVTVRDDKGQSYRPWLPVDARLTDEQARKVALRAASELEGKPRPAKYQPKDPTKTLSLSPTCDEYFEKLWVPSRVGKVKSLDDDIGRWRNHLRKLIGGKRMDEVTTDDLRAVVEALDKKAASPDQPRFGKKSAINCWTVAATMFDDACNSKLAALRILKANPALGVQPPDTPDEVEKQWLFPAELHQLLACEAVPIERRRLYATAVYCCTRPGEALALLWRQGLDVEHNLVRINRAWDSRKRRFNEYTKSGDSRHFAIEPILRPMLEAMFKRRRSDLVFATAGKLAETLRADLLTAGVDRPALHKPKPGAELMRFHDLRATGITYMAMRGDTDNDVRERAGHTDFQTTMMYIRRGHQALGSTIGDPFAPLPEGLISNRPGNVPPPGDGGIPAEIVEREKGFEPYGSSPGEENAGDSDEHDPKSVHANAPGERAGRFPDDWGLPELRADNASRGRRMAAFAEVDQQAAGPGLALCRALESVYAGEQDASVEALTEAYQGLGLADRARAAGGRHGR